RQATSTVSVSPGVTVIVALAWPPQPPSAGTAASAPRPPWAPSTSNVALVTPVGTVQVCAALVQAQVTVWPVGGGGGGRHPASAKPAAGSAVNHAPRRIAPPDRRCSPPVDSSRAARRS